MRARDVFLAGVAVLGTVALLTKPLRAELSEIRGQWWTADSPGLPLLTSEING